MHLIVFCVMGIVSMWLYWLWSRRRFYALHRQIDGPKGWPFIGMAHRLVCRAEILKVFEIYLQKYDNFVLSWLGTYPFVVICDPCLAQDILSSSACINKGVIYESLDDSIGRTLFNLKDPQWTKHRKFLQPAFSQKVLQSMIPSINQQSNDLLSNLKEHALPLNLIQTIQEYTFTLAIKTTMGIPDEAVFMSLNKAILRNYQCILETLTEMCFSPWLRYSWIRRFLGRYQMYDRAKMEIRQFTQKLIKMKLDRDELLEEEGSPSFIKIAIDLFVKKEFTLENVVEECNGIILGAFETTANLIFYTLVLLAMHNQYQETLFEELQANFSDEGNENANGDFFITYNQIQNLVYLDAVVKEVMRVLTPVPLVSRSTCNDVPLSNGIVLPSGVQIVLDIFHLHRRKDIWGGDAHLFNPQHFLADIEDKHPYAFIPFTKGLRNCIGWRYGLMVAKITLAKLLRNFRFSTEFPYNDLEFVEDITLKLKQIPLLCIHKRYFD